MFVGMPVTKPAHVAGNMSVAIILYGGRRGNTTYANAKWRYDVMRCESNISAGLYRKCLQVMAYIAMADKVMAYTVMAYIVMAGTVMAVRCDEVRVEYLGRRQGKGVEQATGEDTLSYLAWTCV